MGKDKHNPPKKPKADFIKFSKVQQAYLNEIRNKQLREFNEAVGMIYEELGIKEKILKAPSGTYKLRVQDCSGLDVLPIDSK
jgi:hypothetical protein